MSEFTDLIDACSARHREVALVFPDSELAYGDLAEKVRQRARDWSSAISHGDVVVVRDEFTATGVVNLLALAMSGAIVIPVSSHANAEFESIVRVGQPDHIVEGRERPTRSRTETGATPHLYQALRAAGRPGLVLFSSGSTGEPKAAVHDFGKILANMPSKALSETLVAFLLFDHIGGVNTLLRTLKGGGRLVIPRSRKPEEVARAIESSAATVLPTSPSFLALLIASGATKRHNMSSLKLITYGTEVMPEELLRRVSREFPSATLKQTYGLSEVGILSTQSESNTSTWLKLGGNGFDTRVVDGLLEVRSDSGMLGYLNHASPYTEDGWFRTFDRVEIRGEFMRILGRESEMINVGGLKVFPQEVESALLALPEIDDCVVYGLSHPLTGQTVAAEVVLSSGAADVRQVRSIVRSALVGQLEPHKVPTRITVVEPGALAGHRFKKNRSGR